MLKSFWIIILLVILSLFNETFMSNYFVVDNVGVYLAFISLIFLLFFLNLFMNSLNLFKVFGITLSIFFAIICFFSIKSLVFWVSYELSMLFALILILYSSPYSERFLASWYLMMYVFFSSLPILLFMVFLSLEKGSWNILLWEEFECKSFTIYILALLFSTKVPLPPFHSWLPVVHAEASSYVSMILSGYIMKLGLMGLLRFCSSIFSNTSFMMTLLFSFSLLFFFSAGQELDMKRWLAFLSLGHILMGILGLLYFNFNSILMVSLYCLGHGLSAFLLFYLFFVLNNLAGSRNWLILSINKNLSVIYFVLTILGLLSVSSFPPTIKFFSEIFVFSSLFKSYMVLLLFCFYIFIGGIVPMIILSLFLVNTKLNNSDFIYSKLDLMTLFGLSFMCYFGIILF